MKKFILCCIFIISIFIIYTFYNQKSFKNIERSYSSMSIEIMSVPKYTIIEDKKISDKIISDMKLKKWNKLEKFEYSLMPNRVIINIDDEYVFWIDAWDENHEICKVERRYGGTDVITGVYKIPIGTLDKIENILNNNNLKWRVQNEI